MYLPPQNLSSNSLLTQALTAEQLQPSSNSLSSATATTTTSPHSQTQQHSAQSQQQQHQFMPSLRQQQQHQQHQQQQHQHQHQQFPFESWSANQVLSSSVPTDIALSDRMGNGAVNGSVSGLSFISGHKGMVHELGVTNEWTSFLASETYGDAADADMEQLLQGNVNEENWGPDSRNHFSMPNPSSFMERAERQQKREIPGELQQQHQHQQHQEQLQQQQHYQLQQQQLLRMQLQLASHTLLPQSPAPGMVYSSSPQLGHSHMPHPYVSGLNQFPTGHSPANSPLSPSSYGGDDYFSSRQVSPGPASSPGGTSKIKSRPRPSATGARVSQGGIKALFGQSLPKTNRASLDLKAEGVPQLAVAGAGPQTPTPKKKTANSLSTEVPPVSQVPVATVGMAAARSAQGLSTPTSENPPAMTLAERRAAASAGSDSTASSQPLVLTQSKQGSLIPPNLGLDSQAKRSILPPNVTPGSETIPLSSPALLSTSASSPAPIQIGRIIPRNSSSQTRTEEQQRLLDDAMERVDFEDVTVAELKEMLRQRGKHGGGKKADLIKRLQAEIDMIRVSRNPANRSSAASAPVPIGSPTNSLHRTLGNMHIGSPPIHSTLASSPSGRRYTPYAAPLGSPGATSHPLGLANTAVVGPAQSDGNANNSAPGAIGTSVASTIGTGHASNLSRSVAVQGGREASSLPVGSPRMSSLLGSSFISSDGKVHQNPIHPLNQRHQTAAAGSAAKRSPPSTHSSPAGSSLRNSLSPESSALEDIESEADALDQRNRGGDERFMNSDALCSDFLTDPGLLAMEGQEFPMDSSFLAALNIGSTDDQGAFGFQPMDLSEASALLSPSRSSSFVPNMRYDHMQQHNAQSQHLYSGVGEVRLDRSHGLIRDDACVPRHPSSTDIKQTEDEFLALSPSPMNGPPMDQQQQQQQQYANGIHQRAQLQRDDQKHQQTMFDFDPHFSTDSGSHQHQHQPLSQDDLDMLLLGSHEDASGYSKDGFMW